MAPKDKDRAQKRMAMEFCIQQGILPYMEVPVVEEVQFQRTPIYITDLDVLGLTLSWNGTIHRTLFDCKTSKDSPINRAIWSTGIVEHSSLDEAYVILKRSALPTHKVTAEEKDIYLFDADGFEQFMKFHGFEPTITTSYLSDLVALDSAQDFIRANPVFSASYEWAVQRSPLERDSARAIRSLLAKLLEISGELDPIKPAHRYLLAEIVAAFCLHLQVAVSRLIRMVGASSDKAYLEEVTKYYLWGGYNNFQAKKKMSQLVLQLEDEEFALPAWSSFIKLIGILIPSVNSLRRVPVAARTLGLRSLSGVVEEYEKYTNRLVLGDRKVSYVYMQVMRYLQEATGFPRPFISAFDEDIEGLGKINGLRGST
ncbi:hypothetical protein CYG48_07635 [Neorhizobium sp. SOG26]|uniref:hypothetical protein n=1 Tax=Neorhizobium sp. SOG26 TaxID=2060726 RepID=UPI000E57F84A|nr:hypothetical protein [Neorhizobium sp. SOG26]AXV15578.1 hypothetical protein CYG48_07635 [Neorhizobium sp. SOG26]